MEILESAYAIKQVYIRTCKWQSPQTYAVESIDGRVCLDTLRVYRRCRDMKPVDSSFQSVNVVQKIQYVESRVRRRDMNSEITQTHLASKQTVVFKRGRVGRQRLRIEQGTQTVESVDKIRLYRTHGLIESVGNCLQTTTYVDSDSIDSRVCRQQIRQTSASVCRVVLYQTL